LNFSIEADGTISRVFVELSADAIFDDEALRVAKSMPKWRHPARVHNRISRVDNVLIPITFTLVSNPIELNK
jgi:outer membrane biosynthesis protein TonB